MSAAQDARNAPRRCSDNPRGAMMSCRRDPGSIAPLAHNPLPGANARTRHAIGLMAAGHPRKAVIHSPAAQAAPDQNMRVSTSASAASGLQVGFTWNLSRCHDRDGDRFADRLGPRSLPTGGRGRSPSMRVARLIANPILAYIWDVAGTEMRHADCRFTWSPPGPGPIGRAHHRSSRLQPSLADPDGRHRQGAGDRLIGDSLGSGQGNPALHSSNFAQ